MPRYPQKEVEARYQKLPPVLKEAMFNADIASKMFEIGKRFALTIEETGFLAEEAAYVILGLTRPQELGELLQNRLGVAAEKAQDITREVNHQIFFPLREALKTTHQIEISEEKILRPVQPPPRPIPPQQAAVAATPEKPAAPQPKVETPPTTPSIPKPTTVPTPSPSEISPPKEKPVPSWVRPQPTPPPQPLPGPQPIDLRPETRTAPQTVQSEPPKQSAEKPPAPPPLKPVTPPPPAEKKSPSTGLDPYREPIE